jgi:hypothetical protein
MQVITEGRMRTKKELRTREEYPRDEATDRQLDRISIRRYRRRTAEEQQQERLGWITGTITFEVEP